MGITISGLASDIDTRQLIDDLMSIERRPINRLESSLSVFQNEKNAWGEVRTQLANLKTRMDPLKQESTFTAKTASSSNVNVATASATHEAVAATYNLSVQQLATSSSTRSMDDVGAPLDLDVAAKDAGFSLSPTNGFITLGEIIDGQYKYVQVDIDNTKTLTEITNDINTALGEAGLSLSVGFENDKFLVSSSVGNDIRLGSGADTSNFLSSTKVLSGTQVGDTIQSSNTLGVVNLRSNLNDARFKTELTQSQGSFKINGVEITWDTNDTSKDSLEKIMNQINKSGAKVQISYDSVADQFSLVNTETGSKQITLEDVEGNFLESIGLKSGDSYAQTTLGKNALYTIDEINGGQQMSASSNTISDVAKGVTFTLKGESETKTRINVNNNTDATIQRITDFVNQYNTTMNNLISQTNSGTPGKPETRGMLASSSSLSRLPSQMRSMTSGNLGSSEAYRNLSDIGISTTGQSHTLSIDQTKLKAALESDPNEVYALFYDGSDGLFDKLDSTLDMWLKSTDGIINTSTKSLDRQIKDTEKRIADMEYRMILKEQQYEAKFLAMERALSQYDSQSQWLDQQLQQFAPKK